MEPGGTNSNYARIFTRVARYAVAVGILSAGLLAEDHAANRIRFENSCAACDARVVVRWDHNGIRCQSSISGKRNAPGARPLTIDLTAQPFTRKDPDTGCILTSGAEVWARIEGPSGAPKICRQNSSQILYDPDGGTVRYRLDGAAWTNAHCRLVAAPKATYPVR